MNTHARKTLPPALGAAVVAATATLTACSESTEPSQESSQPETVTQTTTVREGADKQAASSEAPSVTPQPTVRTVDFGQLQQVSPTQFESTGRKAFTFVNGGSTGECFVDGTVTCQGAPGSEAIQIAADGVAYTIVEGAPPAQAELKPGQWVDWGNAKCAKPDGEALVCTSDSAAFEIAGAGMRIVTEGPVLTSEELMGRARAQPGRGYNTGTDVLVQGPIMCGAMEGHRLAEVIAGEITCAEAMDVLDRYDATKGREGAGETLAVTFGSWECASPTPERSAELNATAVCHDRQRGIEVRAPGASAR